MSQMDFVQAENSSEIKCRRSCAIYPEDKNCDVQDLEYSPNSITCGMLCMKEYPDNLICKMKSKIKIISKVIGNIWQL
jgi:hypothetical protein